MSRILIFLRIVGTYVLGMALLAAGLTLCLVVGVMASQALGVGTDAAGFLSVMAGMGIIGLVAAWFSAGDEISRKEREAERNAAWEAKYGTKYPY